MSVAAAIEVDSVTAPTVAILLAEARDRLSAAGVEAPLRDARLLLGAASGWQMETLVAWPEQHVPGDAVRRFAAYVERRAAREPVSRILGRRGFWDHEFLLAPGALDPRPDSEVVVAEALRRLPAAADGIVVDLGVGSGCLLLSVLAARARMIGVGIDRSADALQVAAANAKALGVDARCLLVRGHWADAVRNGTVACVLTNPPYIPSGEIAGLEPEVRDHDPHQALDGGPDGLVAYRLLGPQVRRLLRQDGFAILEIGADQASAVSQMLSAACLAVEPPLADLGDRDRCIIATAAAE